MSRDELNFDPAALPAMELPGYKPQNKLVFFNTRTVTNRSGNVVYTGTTTSYTYPGASYQGNPESGFNTSVEGEWPSQINFKFGKKAAKSKGQEKQKKSPK